MRVYVPATTSSLHRLADRRVVSPAPVFGCAVTPDLRAAFESADLDELDAEAMATAAYESLRLIAADDREDRRRTVIAVEAVAERVTVDPAAGATAVLVDSEVPIADVVAIFVDEPAALDAVLAAAAALDASDRGDHEATRTVATLEDHRLLWYATQELDALTR